MPEGAGCGNPDRFDPEASVGIGISDTKYQKLSNVFADYVALIEDWI